MWTDVGISTVDRSAPYYRTDGYWNGAVWFPHQWMVWKALLDLGEGEKAHQIAITALNTWEKECKESYYTFEHFIISSQRGGRMASILRTIFPILNWFNAYYRIGKYLPASKYGFLTAISIMIIRSIGQKLLSMIQQLLTSEQFLYV